MSKQSFSMENSREVGEACPPFIVADISSDHQHSIEQARALVRAAYKSGAHALTIQTYTADSLTLPIHNEMFKTNERLWENTYLYDFIKFTHTPWEWYKDLKELANSIGISFFGSPYDETAVDFLEKEIKSPIYKVSSPNITHIPLLRKIGKTKKPVILGTGMATEEEIQYALDELKSNGTKNVILLKNVTAYPAEIDGFNLKSLSSVKKKFDCLVGISDHTLSSTVAIGAVALGACYVEKNLLLTRGQGSIGDKYAITPEEFAKMTKRINEMHESLGSEKIGPCEQELKENQLNNRQSIFVSKDIKKGEKFSKENLRIIRPANGLAPSHWDNVIGKKAKQNLLLGTPLKESDIEK